MSPRGARRLPSLELGDAFGDPLLIGDQSPAAGAARALAAHLPGALELVQLRADTSGADVELLGQRGEAEPA